MVASVVLKGNALRFFIFYLLTSSRRDVELCSCFLFNVVTCLTLLEWIHFENTLEEIFTSGISKFFWILWLCRE